MLNRIVTVIALAALVAGPASALQKKGKAAAGQSESEDRQGDERDRGPPPTAAQPMYAPPAYAAPPPPALMRYTVLTEGQKRCGVQHRCELDSRSPCPPCW